MSNLVSPAPRHVVVRTYGPGGHDEGERRITIRDIQSIEISGNAWSEYNTFTLKSGERINARHGEAALEMMEHEAGVPFWHSRWENPALRGTDSIWEKDVYFAPRAVEAATPSEFYAAGKWYEHTHQRADYLTRVRTSLTRLRPSAVRFPIRDADGNAVELVAVPSIVEGYAGFDEHGYGKIRVGGRDFSTAMQAVTRRLEVAARAAFETAWAGLPNVPTLTDAPKVGDGASLSVQ